MHRNFTSRKDRTGKSKHVNIQAEKFVLAPVLGCRKSGTGWAFNTLLGTNLSPCSGSISDSETPNSQEGISVENLGY